MIYPSGVSTPPSPPSTQIYFSFKSGYCFNKASSKVACSHLDFLGWEHVPVVGEGALLCGLVVDEDLVGVVGGVQDQGVQVGHHIILASDVLLDQVVGAFVAEDDVDFLGARAADVRSYKQTKTLFIVHLQKTIIAPSQIGMWQNVDS